MTHPNHDDHVDPSLESAPDTISGKRSDAATGCGCGELACHGAESASSVTDADATPAAVTEAPPRRRAAVDLLEFDDRWEAFLDLPGVRLEDVELLVDRGILRVTATRRRTIPSGSTILRRELADVSWDERFRLGEDVDRTRIDATLVDGVLRVTLPRRDAARPRRIDVRTG